METLSQNLPKDIGDLDPALIQVLGRCRGGLEGIRGGDIRGTP